MSGRLILLLTTTAAALLMASGVASAAAVYCTPGAHYCSGTNDDVIYGTYGADKIFPEEGDDLIGAADGSRDFINCGYGYGAVWNADEEDEVDSSCEYVVR